MPRSIILATLFLVLGTGGAIAQPPTSVVDAELDFVTQEDRGATFTDNGADGSGEAEPGDGLQIARPGSIPERLRRDAEDRDYLFQFPCMERTLEPWYAFKERLSRDHGVRFGISYTALYYTASGTFGPENDAASFDLDIPGTWTFHGRGTDSPTVLGFDFFYRGKLGTVIPPQTLFTQFGGLYSTAAPYGVNSPVVGDLWIQQKFRNHWGFQVGKVFPITAYDFFPFKNFRLDLIDFNHVTNATIPLPSNGLGGFVVVRPQPNIMLRAGIHDANADVEKSGFDTFNGELFSVFEVGVDPGIAHRQPGQPPPGFVSFSVWHQDRRADAGIAEGWGISAKASQRFGRHTPFIRYGYADGGAAGPTPVKHMVNVGVVIDEIFCQNRDRIGFGYTWSDPADRTLDDQSELDAFYRVQVTPEIAVGPILQAVFDPVRNPDENTSFIFGIRLRMEI